jgi:tetratricopeptide (TPR) repeat protein
MRNAVLVIVAMSAACGAGFAQMDPEAQLTNRIHGGEAVVSSASGRADGVAWLGLANLYEDAARYDDAERAFRKATDLLKGRDRVQYADALDRMGVMYVERGRFGKAEALERKALAIRQDRNDAVGMGTSYMHLALVAYGKHDLRGAEADAEMAVSILVPEHADNARVTGATPEEKMSALIDLSLIRCGAGACEAARSDLERALQLATANYQAKSVPVGFLHFLLGYTSAKSGDVQGGAELMKTGIEEMKTQMGWGHPTYVAALKEYRAVLVRAGRNEDASEVEENIAKLSGATTSTRNLHGFLGMSALR